MDTRQRIETLTARLCGLERLRSTWLSHWEEVADYLLPDHKPQRTFEAQSQGDKRRALIVNSIGEQSLNVLAAGMQGGISSPARPWFRLSLPSPVEAEAAGVREWLHEIELRLYTLMARSNLYTSMHSLYQHLVGFGTALMLMEEDANEFIRCRLLPLGEYCLSANASGVVDTIFRRFKMPARAMLERFGWDNLPEAVRRRLESSPGVQIKDGDVHVPESVGNDDFFEVIWMVSPRQDYDPESSNPKKAPWASLYWAPGEDKFLEEGGYFEKPFVAPRWTVANDYVPYGRGPGMQALPDVKMVQELSKAMIKQQHKLTDPPMLVPAHYDRRISHLPGAQNYVDPNETELIKPLYQFTPDLKGLAAIITEYERKIGRAFFNDLFVMAELPNMTATEVAERREEKMVQLGPVLDRLGLEFFDPVVDRFFGVLARYGLVPQPPEQIAGQQLKVEYVSMVAAAQKGSSATTVMRVAALVGQLAQLNPEVLDKMNFDETVDEYANVLGAPPRITRSDEDVETLRRERAKAQQAAMQAQQQAMQQQQALAQAEQAAKTAKTLSDTPVQAPQGQPQSALEAMVQ